MKSYTLKQPFLFPILSKSIQCTAPVFKASISLCFLLLRKSFNSISFGRETYLLNCDLKPHPRSEETSQNINYFPTPHYRNGHLLSSVRHFDFHLLLAVSKMVSRTAVVNPPVQVKTFSLF